MRYRAKWTTAVVDAYRLPAHGEDVPDSFTEWCQEVGFTDWFSGNDESLDIVASDGSLMTAQPGEWIVKGIDDEFRPCDHVSFLGAFEPEKANAEAQAA